MLHLISNALDFFVLPSNLIAFGGLLALILLLIGWRRIGRSLAALSIVSLALIGWSPLAPWTLKMLEDRFPQARNDGPVAGIVMLGGAVNVHISEDRGAPALNDAGERVAAVAILARRHPDARIILSGGASEGHGSRSMTESALARDLLIAMDVREDKITLEERSADTCENAEESTALAEPKPGETWLLVTSASHMPRSMACFRAAGFGVLPYPVDYRTRDARMMSVAEGVSAFDLATHEWIGLAAYRVTGRTKELFPAP
ncbi:YdcF family protein [Lutibaculum baratangense]|nr:YdcF family protein [Lutibaculum baratangense]